MWRQTIMDDRIQEQFCFYGNICQGLTAFTVHSSIYEYSGRNYASVCKKSESKKLFPYAD